MKGRMGECLGEQMGEWMDGWMNISSILTLQW